MGDQERRTVKKMEVVFEEVFQRANDQPSDPNAREGGGGEGNNDQD